MHVCAFVCMYVYEDVRRNRTHTWTRCPEALARPLPRAVCIHHSCHTYMHIPVRICTSSACTCVFQGQFALVRRAVCICLENSVDSYHARYLCCAPQIYTYIHVTEEHTHTHTQTMWDAHKMCTRAVIVTHAWDAPCFVRIFLRQETHSCAAFWNLVFPSSGYAWSIRCKATASRHLAPSYALILCLARDLTPAHSCTQMYQVEQCFYMCYGKRFMLMHVCGRCFASLRERQALIRTYVHTTRRSDKEKLDPCTPTNSITQNSQFVRDTYLERRFVDIKRDDKLVDSDRRRYPLGTEQLRHVQYVCEQQNPTRLPKFMVNLLGSARWRSTS
jgi:hypothetical protein